VNRNGYTLQHKPTSKRSEEFSTGTSGEISTGIDIEIPLAPTPGVALMDPAYGNDSKLRAGISQLGLTYVAGISATTMVWLPGEAPLLPTSSQGRGRPATRLRRDEMHQPVSAKTLALELPADA
jgi:DDE superfamily endonuclease